MPQPPRQGFSLIELLVTLAVLTILISSAMPALAEFVERQRASAYVRQFSQHLAYARVAATSSNLAVQLCPYEEGECTADWQHLPLQLNLLYPDTEQKTLLREIPPVHAAHNLHYNRSAVTFRRDGSLNGFENGTFYYCPQAQYQWHYRVTLNQAGRSRLTELAEPCPAN
jgi:type IV fimbrial biogenesis protein FimT